jgi:hypothetical protein
VDLLGLVEVFLTFLSVFSVFVGVPLLDLHLNPIVALFRVLKALLYSKLSSALVFARFETLT